MKELTDLEICKRIAEIEGRVISGVGSLNVFVKCEPSLIGNEQYDPLTDDALCFKLMVKHNVSLTYGDYAVTAEILIEKEDGEHSFAAQAYCPKRAICVAIIESKE
jgi:hypothetical protein